MRGNKNKGASRLGYLTHYVVDGGKARVILDVLVTSAEVTENLPMLELLFRSRFRWRLRPRSVTGDAAYGTVENVATVEKAGIRAYVALPKQDERGPLFSKHEFVYDAEKDLYVCPQCETLRRQGCDYKERSIRYAAKSSACNLCPLKMRCTKGKKKGRWIRRSFDEEYLERVRGYQETEPYRKALRKRQVWVEPLFGEAKDWHGARRFRLRRLEKVNVEALLIGAGQNIKRLLIHGHRGPMRPTQGAALRQPALSPYEFCSVRRHRNRRSQRPARVFQQPETFSAETGNWVNRPYLPIRTEHRSCQLIDRLADSKEIALAVSEPGGLLANAPLARVVPGDLSDAVDRPQVRKV